DIQPQALAILAHRVGHPHGPVRRHSPTCRGLPLTRTRGLASRRPAICIFRKTLRSVGGGEWRALTCDAGRCTVARQCLPGGAEGTKISRLPFWRPRAAALRLEHVKAPTENRERFCWLAPLAHCEPFWRLAGDLAATMPLARICEQSDCHRGVKCAFNEGTRRADTNAQRHRSRCSAAHPRRPAVEMGA